MMWIQLFINVVNAVAQYLLIYVFGIGFIGSPIGFTFAQSLSPILLFLYARGLLWDQVRRTWAGWSREAFRDWLPYLKVAFPSAMMMCLEWWGFELMIFLAGLLGPASLAASEIHISLLNFVYMLPLGISVAVNIRVGNQLGAGRPFKARRTSYVGLLFIWLCMLCISGLVYTIRNYWGRVYSDDEDVVQLVAHVLPVACLTVVLDGNQAVSSGILRGCGQVVVGAILNLIAYYIVSLPVGLLLGFKFKLGLLGLWSGMAIAELVVVAFFLFFIFRMDWVRVSHEARERSAVPSQENVTDLEEVAPLESDDMEMELIQRHPLGTARLDSEEHLNLPPQTVSLSLRPPSSSSAAATS
jgi:MATE family multidrug resistance protein